MFRLDSAFEIDWMQVVFTWEIIQLRAQCVGRDIAYAQAVYRVHSALNLKCNEQVWRWSLYGLVASRNSGDSIWNS